MRSVLCLLAVAALVAAPAAHASFPGRNGRLIVTACHALPGDELHRWRATLTTIHADGKGARVIRSFAPVPPEDRCRVNAARWSPDGERLAYTHGGGVIVADARGRDLRVVLAADATAGGWAPDGHRLAAPVFSSGSLHPYSLAIVDGRRSYLYPFWTQVRPRTARTQIPEHREQTRDGENHPNPLTD